MKKQQSIQRRLHSSYLFIVGLLSVPTVLLLLFLLPTTARYHQHINYISDALRISRRICSLEYMTEWR